MTSTDLQGFGCVRSMGTKWPRAGTRDSCGPQPCACAVASSVFAAAVFAAAVFAAAVELPQAPGHTN